MNILIIIAAFIITPLHAEELKLDELYTIVHDAEQLSAFSKECKARSDSLIVYPKVATDAEWEKNKDAFIEHTLWTYPFDHSRTGRDIPGFYLNASDIELEGQQYIACQAPLTSTCNDFWKAILHRNSPTIVMLNMPEDDKDAPKPPVEYWKGSYSVDDWQIACTKEETVADVKDTDFSIVRRTFLASNSKTNEMRTITQFHFQNWPDFEGAPTDALFDKLLELVEDSHPENVPLTVHCAAGMGRTGSFIATHALRRKIRKELLNGKRPEEIRIDLPEVIFKMRECRYNMVSKKGIACIVDNLKSLLQPSAQLRKTQNYKSCHSVSQISEA